MFVGLPSACSRPLNCGSWASTPKPIVQKELTGVENHQIWLGQDRASLDADAITALRRLFEQRGTVASSLVQTVYEV